MNRCQEKDFVGEETFDINSWTTCSDSDQLEVATLDQIQTSAGVKTCEPIGFRQIIEKKLKQNLCTDFNIHIGDYVFKCHRIVFEQYSEYVRDLRPKSKSIHLPIGTITPEMLHVVYSWMLNPDFKLKRFGILEVYAAAKFLKIQLLTEQCWLSITAASLVEDKAFMVFMEAIFYRLPAIQAMMLTRIKRFFLTMVGFVQFLDLTFADVCELLASDAIGVNCELEVFYTCVRYLSYQWEERKSRAFDMLCHVRFGLLPPHVLVSFRYKKESPEINRILENTQVESLLSEIMHFSLGFATPAPESCFFKERKWIYDFDCDYHSTKSYPGKKVLTYESFKDYINFLARSETHWQLLENAEDVEKAVQLRKRKN